MKRSAKESYSFLLEMTNRFLTSEEIEKNYGVGELEFVIMVIQNVNNIIFERKIPYQLIKESLEFLTVLKLEELELNTLNEFINSSYKILFEIETKCRADNKKISKILSNVIIEIIMKIYEKNDLLGNQLFVYRLLDNKHGKLLLDEILFNASKHENTNIYESILINIIDMDNEEYNICIKKYVTNNFFNKEKYTNLYKKLKEKNYIFLSNFNNVNECKTELTKLDTDGLIITLDSPLTRIRDDAFNLIKLKDNKYLLKIYIADPQTKLLERNKVIDIITDDHIMSDTCLSSYSLDVGSKKAVIAHNYIINEKGQIENFCLTLEEILIEKNLNFNDIIDDNYTKEMIDETYKLLKLVNNYVSDSRYYKSDLIANLMTLNNRIVATIMAKNNQLFLYKIFCDKRGIPFDGKNIKQANGLKSRMCNEPYPFYSNDGGYYTQSTTPLYSNTSRIIQMLAMIYFLGIYVSENEKKEINEYLNCFNNKEVEKVLTKKM